MPGRTEVQISGDLANIANIWKQSNRHHKQIFILVSADLIEYHLYKALITIFHPSLLLPFPILVLREFLALSAHLNYLAHILIHFLTY